MLKGKTGLYILLPLNLFIWGYMGYKIYSALNDSETVESSVAMTVRSPLKLDDGVAYVPKVNYKDPFLKEEQKSKNTPTDETQIAHIVRQKPQLAGKKITDIRYLGLIENKTSGLKAAMVSVDGSSRVIKPGQVIEGMLFQSITSDFIIVKIGKEQRTIVK